MFRDFEATDKYTFGIGYNYKIDPIDEGHC